ncbi:hypothetical protein [Desulfonatronum parangueonense]
MSPLRQSSIRACPICGKMVHIQEERHTLFHCRNFLLKQLYQEINPKKRENLSEKVDVLNARLSLKGQNLLDT